jgi:phage terminase large subunit
MRIQATKIFNDIDEAVKDQVRYIFLRGSSRSSKTISALQYLIVEALKNPSVSITIARSTQVSLKNTILVDFKDIMEKMEIYYQGKYNKVDMTYTFPNASIIRFVGLDDTTGRLRGMKSTYVMVDEINTIDRDSFVQLDIRCEKYLIGCYNPELSEDSWIFDYEGRDNARLYVSSWRDNPFLDETIIQSIMELKELDYDLWLIYSEGQLVPPRERIYNPPTLFSGEPENIKATYIGIDYGFSNDETGVVKIQVDNNGWVYATELLYETNLTNEDLIYKLKELGIDRYTEIVSDSSEPKTIETLRRASFKIRGVKKENGSVLYGIQLLRTTKLFVNERSKNLLSEFSNYKYKKDRSGRTTSVPEGKDHLLDALRYSIMEFLDKPKAKYSFR